MIVKVSATLTIISSLSSSCSRGPIKRRGSIAIDSKELGGSIVVASSKPVVKPVVH